MAPTFRMARARITAVDFDVNVPDTFVAAGGRSWRCFRFCHCGVYCYAAHVAGIFDNFFLFGYFMVFLNLPFHSRCSRRLFLSLLFLLFSYDFISALHCTCLLRFLWARLAFLVLPCRASICCIAVFSGIQFVPHFVSFFRFPCSVRHIYDGIAVRFALYISLFSALAWWLFKNRSYRPCAAFIVFETLSVLR